MSTEYYDSLEIRDPKTRQNDQFSNLPKHLRHSAERSTYVKKQLNGIDIDSIGCAEDLTQIPVVRKSQLIDLQRESPPFGGLTAHDEHDFAAHLCIAWPHLRT